MPKQILAIANCRVSSNEQLLNNSLNRQRDAIIAAAQELGVTIPDDGWWSGSVSSKRGGNINRTDLKEMLERCKRDTRIKYVIIDEVDRFMRSMLELAHFIVEFKKLGVRVVFASQPNLKSDNATETLLLMLEAYKAEGSNEERQHKSIAGNTVALLQGRYPFHPKIGYKRGYEKGIHEWHPEYAPVLQAILIKVAEHLLTSSQALVEFNKSVIHAGRSPYKMDKFRKILIDPYYAGIVEIHKQIDVRNENGLHKPLITMEQHLELLRIMNNKPKNQAGPRKNGNPEFPMNNITHCAACVASRGHKAGRYVGFPHNNGKNKDRIYYKYRCRTCGRYLHRHELHQQIERQFSRPLTNEGVTNLIDALETVWKQKEGQAAQEAVRIRQKIAAINEAISSQALAAIDPSNATIKQEILSSVATRKQEVADLEDSLEVLQRKSETDKERFMRFACGFIDNMGGRFLAISQENRLRCKQVVFPAGFYLDEKNKVYTPEISPLYRLATMKKDAEASSNSFLVRVRRL
ncbi:recombinase family protein [Candidatus Saccharibacteria bacterium]|nr:recombinase family protein [Candidatus Saccharibacteria bacterium]